jgi:phosphate transport system permease protein
MSSVTSPGESPTGNPKLGRSRHLGDLIFGGSARLAGLVVVVAVVLIAVFLLDQAIPAIHDDHGNFLTSTEWSPTSTPPIFGIAQMLWTTIATSVVGLAFAVPFSIAIALFITHYAPRWLAGTAVLLIDLLAAVPSIVYGLWGWLVLAPKMGPVQGFLQDVLGWIPLFSKVTTITGGTDIFTVGIVLAIMTLPIVTAITREVFAQTPAAHKEAALALGATKWEMVRTAVLPFGKAGIISASMLGLGRALGETIAVLYILSTLPNGAKFTLSLFGGGSTFASNIANNASEFTPGVGTGAFIAAGLVLFVLTFVVNAVARIIIERSKAFSE